MTSLTALRTPVAAGRGLALALVLWCAPSGLADDPLGRCLESKPIHRWTLPALFREVSGLALASDGRLFLHNDEQGVVATLDPLEGRVLATYFLGPGTPRDDFEGIAIAGDRLILVTSAGRLYETRVPNASMADRSVLPFRATDTGLGRQCEIEGLGYEPDGDLLLVACKNPRKKSLEGQLTIFRWSLARAALAAPDRLSVPSDELAKGRPGKGFHASALERDPRTGNYVVVAGPDRAFAVLSPDGRLVATGPLGRHHPQAEGIAIGARGLVMVSDEGGRREGTVTVYDCR